MSAFLTQPVERCITRSIEWQLTARYSSGVADAQWRRDYEAMRESMFFGEAPEFIEILSVDEEDFNAGRHRDSEPQP